MQKSRIGNEGAGRPLAGAGAGVVRMQAIAILLLLTALPAGCRSGESALRSIPVSLKKVILFENFTNNSVGDSKTKFNGFRRGFPAMILDDFFHFGTFRPVTQADRQKALKELAFSQSGLTESSNLEIGKIAGAELILTGDFLEFNNVMTISARVINVKTQTTLALVKVSGSTNETLHPPRKSLLKKLSLGLLAQMKFDLENKELRLIQNRVETRKIDAALNNYAGELLLDRAEREKVLARMKKAGLTLEQIKRLEEEARERFRKALKYDEDYEKARRNLEALTSLLPPPI